MWRRSAESRRRLEKLDRSAIADLQLSKLNELLTTILPTNRLYANKLAKTRLPLRSLEQLAELPFTSKEQLAVGSFLPANLTWPLENYSRYHETSGTRGRPLPVYDTSDDWQWWIDAWQFTLDAARMSELDRVLLAFSFGPFIGFWSAHDALTSRGALVIPAGGMSSRARLELIRRTKATALFCTPTYAIHLADAAAEHRESLVDNSIRKVVVAGEPGGSVSSIRQRIEEAWGARVIDHAGASEVGPWGYGDAQGRGLYVLETEFIAEFLTVPGGKPAQNGELSQLVITSLGRRGMPVIRYRTGDLVRPTWNESPGDLSAAMDVEESRAIPKGFVFLQGGVLGRADDMMVVRGVNIFPSSIDEIVRSFPEVVEYRMTVRKRGELDELLVEVEDRLDNPARIAEELNLRLALKVDVKGVAPMSLPRFEGKGKRFVDLRRG